ncbi:MAG: hypoxanthine phosphoribosyltransferase [Nitrospirales bacterium]|nr:MAG: hypoxanthine phosphoribosyltransferase [Nitrospirales bacterium]
MTQLFGKPLVTQEAMRTRIKELGRDITQYYQHKDLVLVGVLKGAFMFYADLVRAIRLPVTVDFMIVKSQLRGNTTGKVKVLTDLTEEIQGRDVLLVEDIVDSGLTVQHLTRQLSKRKPKSLQVCALLSKPARRQIDVNVHYIGFEIPNHYVVGYGLDYQQQYRNLPYLAVLDPKSVEAP